MPKTLRPSPLLNFELIESRLIWVQDRHLEKSRITNEVTVEDIPAWFVRQGRLVVSMGRERIEGGGGRWILPRQGEGRVHTMPNSKILSLRFRLRWPNGREVYRRRKTLVIDPSQWPELTSATNALLASLDRKTMWYAARWNPGSCAGYFATQACFHRWLAAYGRIMEAHGGAQDIADAADSTAQETRRALLDWDLAKPFSRKTLSRQLGAGVQTISRRFNACYGTTPRAFLEQRKLEWARERLAQGNERVKVIAAELGFVNLAQFSNWFRLRNQLSPREYRDFTREKSG